MDGYHYIADRLGYRYVVQNCNVTEFSGFRHKSTLSVDIKNTGFSPSYKRFSPCICIVNTETKEIKNLSLNGDSRTWYPGETVPLSCNYDFSYFADGTYDVYFYLKDLENNYRIPCANTLFNDEVNGYYMGRITME